MEMSNDTIQIVNKQIELLINMKKKINELNKQIELSTSNVVNIRQKIEELQKQIEESQKALDTEEQHQEELKKEMATISQQLRNKVNEPEPEPEPEPELETAPEPEPELETTPVPEPVHEPRPQLSEDEAAKKIQKIFQCFQIKIRRSKIPESFIKGLQEDTLKRLHLVYNFRTGEKRKFKHLLYNLSMRGRRKIINILNKTIYNSEKVVCIIPGCKVFIHPTEKKNHLKTVHNIYNRPNSSKFQIYKFLENHDYEDDCPICLDKLNNEKVKNREERIIHMPNCQHVYHKSCIDKSWLKTSNRIRDCWESRDKQWNCAICRENVFKPSEYQYNNSRYTYEVGIFSNVSQYRICYNKCIEITNGGWNCTRQARLGCSTCWQH